MSDDIDKTAKCVICRHDIEHYAGKPGSEYMTPFWRHVELGHPHGGAVPDPDTIKEVEQ